MRKSLFGLAAGVWLGIMAGVTGAAAQEKKPVELIIFPGAFNWPAFVAQDKGFFADNGLEVNISPTPNSAFQLVGLIDGDFDIAMTAMDNVIAYSEGQGSAPTKTTPDIFAFLGADSGMISLVATPDVKSYDDLKGKQVGVDALTTGFAFVLRKMLEVGGLQPGDFEFVQAGGVMSRFDALMKQEFAATILVSPLEVPALRAGFNNLGSGAEALGAYQSAVGAARRDWARENEAELVGFIRAYRAALDWLYDPANKEEALAIVKANVPTMDDDVATVSYGILVNEKSGFTRDASLDPAGIETVLRLRSEYGEPRKELTDPERYYDLRFYESAQQ